MPIAVRGDASRRQKPMKNTHVHAHSKAASGGYADFLVVQPLERAGMAKGRNNDVVECCRCRSGRPSGP